MSRKSIKRSFLSVFFTQVFGLPDFRDMRSLIGWWRLNSLRRDLMVKHRRGII